MKDLYTRGVTDLESYNIGYQDAEDRIIKLLEARCLWLVHLDRLAEANELSLQIALIKGENNV